MDDLDAMLAQLKAAGAEIDLLLSRAGTVYDATAEGLRILITTKARRLKRFAIEGLSYDDTAQVAALKEALALYGGCAPTVAVTFPALLPMDAGFTEPTS